MVDSPAMTWRLGSGPRFKSEGRRITCEPKTAMSSCPMQWDGNFLALLLLGNAPELESGLRFRDERFKPKLRWFFVL